MDPETTLGEIRALVASLLAARGPLDAASLPDAPAGATSVAVNIAEQGMVLAEKVEALDGWLSRGGFAPAAWRGAEMEDHR